MNPTVDARSVVEGLFQSLGLPLNLLREHLYCVGNHEKVLPSSFNLGLAAQSSIAASGLSAAQVHAMRTGEMQNVSVNARHAALEFHSEAYYTINGSAAGDLWDDLAGLYPTGDASFVRIHTNFPHHRAGILSILNLPSSASRQAVANALLQWNSKEFEAEAFRRRMCAVSLRSLEEWNKHPQAEAIKDTPPIQLIKIANAPKRSLDIPRMTNNPLGGVRVLDLTRVLAGPICGRTLAAHGADVLLVTSPNLPSLPNLDPETSRGKRTTQLDLTTAGDRERLWSLVRETDVFLQGYRPGGLAAKGFSGTALAEARPGIVCANLCAWGWDGPWKDQKGFDSLVQTATGFNFEEAKNFCAFGADFPNPEAQRMPKPLPVQALDHAAAYLLATGINAALYKTMTEGGSWEVRVSLAAVGNWIRSLGILGPRGFTNVLPKRTEDEIAALSKEFRITQTGNQDCGTMLALKHSAILEKSPVIETSAPAGLDVDTPVWLPRI